MNKHQQVRDDTILDDTTRHVARVYAEALYNAADKRQEAVGILEDLEGLVNQVFRRDPGIEAFLASAAVGRERKAQLIRRAFEGRASDLLVNFLQVLNEHDRLDLLRAIAAAYRDLYDRRSGRIHVHVRSAVPLGEDQQEKLKQELRASFGKEPMLDTRVDPDLLGGLVVRVGDWLYDASVRTRLQDIRDQVIERSSHEIQSGRDRFRS